MANVTGPVSTGTIGPIAALQAALAAGLNPFAAVVDAFRHSFGLVLPAVPGSSPPITIKAPGSSSIVAVKGSLSPGFANPPAPPKSAPPPPPPAPGPPPPHSVPLGNRSTGGQSF